MIDIDKIMYLAMKKDASDIHLIAGIKPVMRVRRDLISYEDFDILTEEDMWEIYDYFVRGNVDKDRVFKETKRLDSSFVFSDIRLRVNISLSNEIPVVTLRLIKNQLPSYESLGVPDIVRRMMYQPQGLILVTGKTNSGKTTTLNALINEINENQNKKILTLESPIEYKHKCKKSIIVQKEVGVGQDCLTYSSGVKNSLREDCDILVIGEIRDKETMDAAIETAEAGHLDLLYLFSGFVTAMHQISYIPVSRIFFRISHNILLPEHRHPSVGMYTSFLHKLHASLAALSANRNHLQFLSMLCGPSFLRLKVMSAY